MEQIKILVELIENIRDSMLTLMRITEGIYERLKEPHPSYECKCNTVQEDKILYKSDVMEQLRISSATYYRLKDEGTLVPLKMGRRDYYLQSSLLELLQIRKKKGK